MPPSQLKRLKASLRESGITGPQKSRKQKKNQKNTPDAHAKKAAALASIRQDSNPFDFKTLSRPKKFEYTTNRPQDASKPLGRPGVTKSLGEEARRKTLLPEMNRRNKVGGILDRRIGEDDPGMSLDDRMMARFEREQQRKRGGNVFDLEGEDDEMELTHGGRPLGFDLEDEDGEEDYDAKSLEGESEDEEDGFLRRKRRRDDEGEEVVPEAPKEDEPERKKSKKEVMEEVIAKSKQYKYERQAQKEDDLDIIDALNKDLPDVLAALGTHLRQNPPAQEPRHGAEVPKANDFGMNADRAALLADKSISYDKLVRTMMSDARAKPVERTKTNEEIAIEEVKRLKELEQARLRRMRGEESDDNETQHNEDDAEESVQGDAAPFGLPTAPLQETRVEFDDEDDFIMDLVATDSEADMAESESEEEEEDSVDNTIADDDDFLRDILPQKAVNGVSSVGVNTGSKLAYTYDCPRSHEEFLTIIKDASIDDVPTIIQRIRALHHAGLGADNKNKLADFACSLIDHISYLANQKSAASLPVIETIIRHIHSLSKAYPVKTATKFREHLKKFHTSNEPNPGILTILTAIGSIYPTSDHFHQVVTPAITLIARWLGLTAPASAQDITTGAYLIALCIQWQQLPKRYIPEVIRYTILCLKSPHITPALTSAHTKNIIGLADLWSSTPAFIEIFTPLLAPLTALHQTSTIQRLKVLLQNARLHRRPQELHHHRPLPIKSNIPKFEESFDPTKHYSADKEASEAKRLAKEYRRERKGALRELRKDANFIHRTKLKEKKEKDAAYELKYRRLVAEIQGEEGREANAYEREKRSRKRRG